MRTYSELQAAIKNYLARNDLDDMIPTFIAMAEAHMQQNLQLRVMERISTHALEDGQDNVALPDRREDGNWDVYMNMREVALAGSPRVNLQYVAPDVYTDMIGSASGRTSAYTIIGRHLYLAPAAGEGETVILTYYAQIPPLSARQPANDVLLLHPNLYLYGALWESSVYTRESSQAVVWQERFNTVAVNIQYMDRQARFSRQLQARPPRRI